MLTVGADPRRSLRYGQQVERLQGGVRARPSPDAHAAPGLPIKAENASRPQLQSELEFTGNGEHPNWHIDESGNRNLDFRVGERRKRAQSEMKPWALRKDGTDLRSGSRVLQKLGTDDVGGARGFVFRFMPPFVVDGA